MLHILPLLNNMQAWHVSTYQQYHHSECGEREIKSSGPLQDAYQVQEKPGFLETWEGEEKKE